MLAAGLALAMASCSPAPPAADVVAQVGNNVLTEADLARALSAVPPGTDSLTARDQYVEQWVTNHLLAQEARRRGLRDQENVQRQLAENERTVLASALLTTLYDEYEAGFSRADIETYYERNRNRLRLREPYVRVRFVETASQEQAEAARSAMQDLMRTGETREARDSIFVTVAQQYSVDASASTSLANSYVPQSRLTRQAGESPWTAVSQLGPGETSPVLTAHDGTFLVLQLVERLPAGTEPELEWVIDDIRRQLAIQSRKQMVAREVQRLRTEAEARGELRLHNSEELP